MKKVLQISENHLFTNILLPFSEEPAYMHKAFQ